MSEQVDSTTYSSNGQLLTVKDVAAYLKVSESMIYRMMRDGLPTEIQGPRCTRFRRESVDAWLALRKQVAE